jgi:hypothetical protein
VFFTGIMFLKKLSENKPNFITLILGLQKSTPHGNSENYFYIFNGKIKPKNPAALLMKVKYKVTT